MPELPEVETVVRGLRPLLVGRRLDAVVARRPDLRWPLPADLGQRLTGATVVGIRRRAKYGLLDTDRGDTLLFHLGMSGKFHPLAGEPGRHDHVLFTSGGATLAFHDPRRFGSMHLVATPDAPLHPLLARLGPEPLSADFTAHSLAAAAQGRRTPVKALLLDQQVVAGIGNIYACEALFGARIAPQRPASALSARQCARLVEAVQSVLTAAIEAGGSTLRDHAQPSGDLGYFQHAFRVYGRAGLACPHCARPVQRIIQSGRSSFFCPHCQA